MAKLKESDSLGASMRRQRTSLLVLSLLFLLSYIGFSQESDRQGFRRADSAKDQSGGASAKQVADSDVEDSSDSGSNWHLNLGTIWLGAGYSHFSGPLFFPYGPYGFYPYDAFYSSLFWNPWFGPYPAAFSPAYFSYGHDKGEVKLKAQPKSSEVFLNGAYAGTADHLKTIWLEPGAYNLCLSAKDREPYQQRIYVLSGKSLKITATLMPTKEKQP